MVRLPRNEKQTHRLSSRLQVRPSGVTLAMTLTLNFQGQMSNWLYLCQKWSDCHKTKSKHINGTHQVPKMVRLPRTKKQTYRLISRLQIWPSGLTLAMTLTFNNQGQMQNWLYLCQKWSDCHKTKSKHINGTLGLKCDHQIWPWHWPWPWIFKVKYEICYISTKSGPIAMKQKANLSIWTRSLKCDYGFDLGHDIGTFLTSYVILTIWWPRSGVRIYQIVPGVTSDVGVPSTHLVLFCFRDTYQSLSDVHEKCMRSFVCLVVNHTRIYWALVDS